MTTSAYTATVSKFPPRARTLPDDESRRRIAFNVHPKTGSVSAFIHAYTLVNGRPPAQADMQHFFRVTPPAVHQMLLTLEKAGLISRQPGVPRCVAVTLDREQLPRLNPPDPQPVKCYVTRY